MDVSWSPDRQETYNVGRTLSEGSNVSATELTYRRSPGGDSRCHAGRTGSAACFF
jgi:hypothetical protein